ncbi:MAG: hypothetical protein M1833_001170 [Piccolia ochrophora]|nr:MAG: hypothetical protein M1833_001170 [Piccolia ochrophora]
MASRTPSRGRSPSRTPTARSHSPSRSHSPRRSISPRSVSRSRRASRTPSSRGARRRNGTRRTGNWERSTSRSPVRGRSGSPSRRPRRYRSSSGTRSPSRGGRSASPAPRSAKVVVEKLTKNVNEGHLREIFSTYGPIKELDMPMNRQFMTNRGTAYVLYDTSTDAEAAIAHMHEAQLDGTVINLEGVPFPITTDRPRGHRQADIEDRHPATEVGGIDLRPQTDAARQGDMVDRSLEAEILILTGHVHFRVLDRRLVHAVDRGLLRLAHGRLPEGDTEEAEGQALPAFQDGGGALVTVATAASVSGAEAEAGAGGGVSGGGGSQECVAVT